MFFRGSKSIFDDVKAHQTPKLKQKIYIDNLKYIYLGKDSFGKNHYRPTQKNVKRKLEPIKGIEKPSLHRDSRYYLYRLRENA